MLGSLRVRLPLVFLAGIILAGIVTTLIAVRLFRDFARDQALAQLSLEAHGVAALYANSISESYANKAGKNHGDRQAPAKVTAESLTKATGDLIFFAGPHHPFPGLENGMQPIAGLQRLPTR